MFVRKEGFQGRIVNRASSSHARIEYIPETISKQIQTQRVHEYREAGDNEGPRILKRLRNAHTLVWKIGSQITPFRKINEVYADIDVT